jgi:phospholipase/carboxylesterase
MMSPQPDAVRIAPKSGGPAQQLVVFLHGYGSNGDDLVSIGQAWQELMPHAAMVFPHGPDRYPEVPGGRQWFVLTFREPDERWIGVTATAPWLDAFIDDELKRHNLPPSALALVGFSQGTMMALHVGLRRAVAPAAIVGYSGMLVLPAGLDPDKFPEEIRSKPPVLLVHGDQDDVIPAQALFQAAQVLAALEVPVQWHLSLGVAHGIDPEGLRQGGEFLACSFKGR